MKEWCFRPWGNLNWVLNKCPKVNWSLLGSISTEDRWISALWQLYKQNRLEYIYLTDIEDEPSRFYQRQRKKIQIQKRKYFFLNGNESHIHFHKLLALNYEIVKVANTFMASSGPNVVLDISTLPKRYFFPFVKLILRNKLIKNFLVTYTIPKSYSHESLAEDFQDWRPIPLFTGKYSLKEPNILIASVGYLTMGLPEQIEKGTGEFDIKFIFPFPPGPPSFQRSWEFVRNVEKNIKKDVEIKIVDTKDVSSAYDYLLSISDNGRYSVIFAPFGPKTISLAMCIYASLTDSPVFYTQPITYHPDYSSGILKVNGFRETYAYCLRLDGRNYFDIS